MVVLWVKLSTMVVLLHPALQAVEGKSAEVKRMAHDEFHVNK